jgi:tRNA dimethylallyltransferase
MTEAIFLMGPTASGKTQAAVNLVQQFPVEIISVDSAMIYRDMDIGTAKPDAQTLAIAPHRMIDIINPDQSYSVAEFCQQALREIGDIRAQGRIPLLVGGTMMYFRAMREGLAPLPEADTQIRASLEAMANEKGWAYLHERLQQVDPEAAAKISQNDPQRIQRALEVYELSGKPLSELQAQPVNPFPYSCTRIVLAPPKRQSLHPRIAQRFDLMLEQGFIKEVEQLREKYQLNLDMPSMRCVGYRQVWQYLESELDKEQMRAAAIHATEQLGKRQYTWLRNEHPDLWLDSLDSGWEQELTNLVSKVVEFR